MVVVCLAYKRGIGTFLLNVSHHGLGEVNMGNLGVSFG